MIAETVLAAYRREGLAAFLSAVEFCLRRREWAAFVFADDSYLLFQHSEGRDGSSAFRGGEPLTGWKTSPRRMNMALFGGRMTQDVAGVVGMLVN